MEVIVKLIEMLNLKLADLEILLILGLKKTSKFLLELSEYLETR